MKFYTVIKYYITIFVLLIIFSLNSVAQVAGAKHQKLMDLYVMGRYEDCLIKAQKISENDKYKNESEAYLWIAMCLIEVTNDPDPDMQDFYPRDKTIKAALKNGAKFKKKDDKLKSKEKEYLYDENEDFMYELIELALIDAKAYLAADNYSKASYYYKLAAKMDPENQECKLINGVLYLYNRNREGQVMVDDALDYFRSRAEAGGYEGNPKSERAFVDGFYYYSKLLEKNGKTDEAFDVIALAIKLDPKNQKFVQRYKQLSGE
jgi:tetratricopeptide (TPR) repeat protein